jgi:23S rRNA (cytidine1920-2'-O)/16S rRNA (cytidine1409-2'-O)-methyltransferase
MTNNPDNTRYVSRAALKLESVADQLKLDFKNKTVLDIGSSTGGFTDYALQNGASKVMAVEVGTNQLHPSLRGNSNIELHEKTDIRDFDLAEQIDTVLIDLSFISLRDILPGLATKIDKDTLVVAMVKPQFEAEDKYMHKGIIKNDQIRRTIFKDFEAWIQKHYVVKAKADSKITGSKGNQERFYLLQKA